MILPAGGEGDHLKGGGVGSETQMASFRQGCARIISHHHALTRAVLLSPIFRQSSDGVTNRLILLENLLFRPIFSISVQQLKGGGLMSHCHMPNAADLVSAASAEARA